jgi:nucleoside-diphosphate-sugar epimerase
MPSSTARPSVDERDESYDVVDANVRATFNVVAFARARGVRTIVNLSSIAVYGAPPAGPIGRAREQPRCGQRRPTAWPRC